MAMNIHFQLFVINFWYQLVSRTVNLTLPSIVILTMTTCMSTVAFRMYTKGELGEVLPSGVPRYGGLGLTSLHNLKLFCY